MSEKSTLVEKIFTQLKNNRIVAFLVVFGLIVIAISRFTDASYKLIQQVQNVFPIDTVKTVTLRSKPEVLSSEQIKVMLSKNNFYDKQWNPGGKGLTYPYQVQARSNTVVLMNEASGLMWQKGGSILPMVYADAWQYVNRLNEDNFAGFNDWRLPTAEEAMSLMEPLAPGGVHINEAFQRGVNFIWTSDRSTDGRVWMLYFYDGRIVTESESFNAWVRVVR